MSEIQPTHDDDERRALVAILDEAFGRYGLPAHMDVPASILAALRDAGWVDPEEAARLREERNEWIRWHMDASERLFFATSDRERLERERDALLSVVEAARAWAVAWEAVMNDPTRTTMRHQVLALLTAVDALDQTAPETALSATQSADGFPEAGTGVDGSEGSTGLSGRAATAHAAAERWIIRSSTTRPPWWPCSPHSSPVRQRNASTAWWWSSRRSSR